MKLNGLEKCFKTTSDFLEIDGSITDFKQINNVGYTALIYAFIYNKEKDFNLNKEQWNYLIKNSDLKHISNYGNNPLMYAFVHNKKNNLNLTLEQFDFLIKNSDLKHINKFKDNSLMYALRYNESQNLNLNKKQWKYLIENSDSLIIKDKNLLFELKKIQSELLNDEILNKIDITKEIKNNHKI